MNTNPLQVFIEGRYSEFADEAPVPEPPVLGFQRELKICDPPETPMPDMSIDEARTMMDIEIENYLNSDANHMLLIRTTPGTGKTTTAVRAAERIALLKKRVAYVGPRHDFFTDVMAIAEYPDMWYEWQPRCNTDDITTCIYTQPINNWMAKGYQAMDFCSGVCGWDYIKTCPYHMQKNRKNNIVFIQHAHVSLGHPLDFHVVIGDENPLNSFMHKWRIKSQHVIPDGLPLLSNIRSMMEKIQNLSMEENRIYQGAELIEKIGGAENVIKTFSDYIIQADAIAAGNIHSIEEAEFASHFHLPQLAMLLVRAAKFEMNAQRTISRVIVGSGGVTMLLRRSINDRLPAKKIWLDATANEHLYREVFNQDVKMIEANPKMKGKIYIITDRLNGKRGMVNDEERAPKHLEQSKVLIRKLIDKFEIKQPGIVTFQALLETFEEDDIKALNFYGARGTNALEHVDGLFILGAPMPSIKMMVSTAAMIYFNRDVPLADKFVNNNVKYQYIDRDGMGREYASSGFWFDNDMQQILWQMREAEIIQAVHRARPLHRDVLVFLLANLPIAELPAYWVGTSAQLFNSPTGVNLYRWFEFEDWIKNRDKVTVNDVVKNVKLERHTASAYLKEWVRRHDDWEFGAVKKSGQKGRPAQGATRNEPIYGN